ncbi:hypothetical protein [Arachnia propionica]|uniref:hypothetical protein n=1 Tax=Arachnia propionica TaxID=1750 RepID=UPI00163A25AF
MMRWSEIREAIRRRPGMYIGGRPDGEGAARLLLSYLVEPALRLGARRVELTVAPGPWFTLRHDGPRPRHEDLTGLDLGKGWGDLGVLTALTQVVRLDTTGEEASSLDGPSGHEMSGELDPEIFTVDEVDAETLADRFRELAWLHPGATLTLRSPAIEETWHQPGGLLDCVEALAEGMGPALTAPVVIDHRDEERGVAVQVAVRRGRRWPARILSFVGGQRTRGGGSHQDALRTALLDERDLLPDGLAAVITVEVDEPSYAGATKDRLDDEVVARVVAEACQRYLASLASRS